MQKRIAVAFLAIVILLGAVAPVAAGGDKNRGDVGQGTVAQHHESWCGWECRP